MTEEKPKKQDKKKKEIKVEEVVAEDAEETVLEVDELPVEETIIKAVEETEVGSVKELIKDDFDLNAWTPKTWLGHKVKNGEIKNMDEILDDGLKVMEAEIVDALVPGLEKDLLLIGQSKGKFGGGQRRVFKQTQKKTPEGNKPHFATYAVIGNRNGYIGVGYGKAKETVPAREKAFRSAKLSLMRIKRGCGSWQCGCKTHHSIPFEVEGRCGSVRIRLLPAPKGTGLKVEKSCATILELAGVKDVWSKSFGQTRSKINLIKACMDALEKLNTTKVKPLDYENLGIVEGKIENR